MFSKAFINLESLINVLRRPIRSRCLNTIFSTIHSNSSDVAHGSKQRWLGQSFLRKKIEGSNTNGPNPNKNSPFPKDFRKLSKIDLCLVITLPYFALKTLSAIIKHSQSKIINWQEFVEDYATKNEVFLCTFIFSHYKIIKIFLPFYSM